MGLLETNKSAVANMIFGQLILGNILHHASVKSGRLVQVLIVPQLEDAA